MNRVPFRKLPLISKIETREKVRTQTDVGRYIRVYSAMLSLSLMNDRYLQLPLRQFSRLLVAVIFS